MAVNRKRITTLKEEAGFGPGPVIYWMSRDQRASDNWALLYSQELALALRRPLAAAFCLAPRFLGAAYRQYAFMLKGLMEVEETLSNRGIPFYLLPGPPDETLPALVTARRAAAVVTDFDPLRIKMRWKKSLCGKVAVPVYEVDAHNIVPCREASDRQEYGAYTFRPKVKRLLPEFLEEFPRLRRHPFKWKFKIAKVRWREVFRGLEVDRGVPEATWIRPGEKAAVEALRRFVKNGLEAYGRIRNDPSLNGQSNLSPYLHFGQISAQRAALEVLKGPPGAREAFLEELIVRRELSDNFCLHNPDYDNFGGFPRWSRDTLNRHRKDRRPYIYSRREFEAAVTHDPLWNAAQTEMLRRGKMHGYMRMYWAKKILEWSASPEEALKTAVHLNDRYELDGRDPNGYAGIAWSIGGLHDRAWGERPVFGKVRYMSGSGLRAKFDIDKYAEKYGKTINGLRAA